MTSPETEFRARLEKKIQNGMTGAIAELVAGGAYVPNFENYHFRTGFLKALQQCLDLCAEVEIEMQR